MAQRATAVPCVLVTFDARFVVCIAEPCYGCREFSASQRQGRQLGCCGTALIVIVRSWICPYHDDGGTMRARWAARVMLALVVATTQAAAQTPEPPPTESAQGGQDTVPPVEHTGWKTL